MPSPVSPIDEASARFGAQVASRRRSKNLTQEELAVRVGISRNQLQNIEQGMSDRSKRTPSNPRLSTLVGLCRELGGTVRIDLTDPSGVAIQFDADLSGA